MHFARVLILFPNVATVNIMVRRCIKILAKS